MKIPDDITAFNYKQVVESILPNFIAEPWPSTDECFRVGGESITFFARDKSLDMRPCVIKIANKIVRDDKNNIARFFRGAAIQSKLHNNVIGIPDIYQASECFYVMQYIRGKSLFDGDIACLVKLLLTIHTMHEYGFVHRDIKIENTVVSKNGTPYLLDFGMAKAVDNPSGNLTGIGISLGTPLFQSEQLKKDAAKASFPDDIHQIGCLLWCWFMKRNPQHDEEYLTHLASLPEMPSWSKYYFGCTEGKYKTVLQLANELKKDFGIEKEEKQQAENPTTTPKMVEYIQVTTQPEPEPVARPPKYLTESELLQRLESATQSMKGKAQ